MTPKMSKRSSLQAGHVLKTIGQVGPTSPSDRATKIYKDWILSHGTSAMEGVSDVEGAEINDLHTTTTKWYDKWVFFTAKERQDLAPTDDMTKEDADSRNRELANLARMGHAQAWRRAAARAHEAEETQ